MFLSDANIQDFRGIENIDLEFNPGINLIIGDNGAGKTSILEALAVGLNGLLSGIPGVPANGFQKDDFRQKILRVTNASNVISYAGPRVNLSIDVDGEMIYCSRRRDDPSGYGKSLTTGSEAKKYLQNIANDVDAVLPILSYMSISRVISSKRADFGKKQKNELNDRRCGYIGSLDGIPSKNSIMEWIMKMSYEAHFQNTEIQEIDLFNNTISKIMRSMNELATNPSVRYSSVFHDIVYREGDDELPVTFLSAGYQSVLWIAMDLAFRLAQLNPTMKDSSDASGIVLLDEIDMHLHPKWQWNAVGALAETFPNIQFIIATHAPIVISSCKTAKIIHINEYHEVDYPSQAYAYSINDVVELRQGSSGIPKQLQLLKKNFENAYYHNNMTVAQDMYEKMLDLYGPDNAEVKSAKRKLDF